MAARHAQSQPHPEPQERLARRRGLPPPARSWRLRSDHQEHSAKRGVADAGHCSSTVAEGGAHPAEAAAPQKEGAAEKERFAKPLCDSDRAYEARALGGVAAPSAQAWSRAAPSRVRVQAAEPAGDLPSRAAVCAPVRRRACHHLGALWQSGRESLAKKGVKGGDGGDWNPLRERGFHDRRGRDGKLLREEGEVTVRGRRGWRPDAKKGLKRPKPAVRKGAATTREPRRDLGAPPKAFNVSLLLPF